MPANSAAPRPRRSLVRRVLVGCVAFGAILSLVLGLAGWWLWKHRVEWINRLLSTAGPVRGSVTDFALGRGGTTLRGFELRDTETRALILRLPEIVVEITVGDILNRRVRLVALNDAEISLSEPILARLSGSRRSGDSPGGVTLPGGWDVARVELRQARLHYIERGGIKGEITADLHADDVSTRADGMLSVGGLELRVAAGSLATGDRAPLKLDALRASGRVEEGRIELEEVAIEKPVLALTPALLGFLAPGAEQPAAARAPASFVQSLSIGRLTCDNLALSSAGFSPGNIAGIVLPDVEAKASYEMTDFKWSAGGAVVPGAQRLSLEFLELKPSAGAGRITCRAVTLALPPPRAGHWMIGDILLREPEIVWTPDLRRVFSGSTPEPSAGTGAGPAAPATGPWSWQFQRVDLRDAQVSFDDAGLAPFEIRGRATLSLRDLMIDAQGWHSAALQSLEVTEVALAYPAKDDFFKLDRGELAIHPDAWNESKAVEVLALERPVLRVRGGNTPWFDGRPEAAATGAGTEEAQPGPGATGTPFWQQLQFRRFEIAGGAIDLASTPGGNLVEAHATLAVTTDATTPGLHRARFENFVVFLPGLTLFPFPVARVSVIECAASLPGMWSTHHVESVQVTGANIEVGSALMKVFEPGAGGSGVGTPAAPGTGDRNPASEPKWTAGRFGIEDSFVSLDRIVPGMDMVAFEVALDLKNAPLSPAGMAADIAPQRAELARLLIPSPFGGAPVAKLDSVFVEFSPAGLVARRIDKVEIVSPTLFIGEPLFWYVDYYRRQAAEQAAEQAPGPETGVAAPAIGPRASQPAWDMGILQVHRGRLVIAPKGVPVAGFRTPFPFSFTSELSNGTLQADFEIPEDNYELPNVKLKFEGMSGNVQFNLPVRGRDNNVTQIFKVKRIRWKDLHIEDAFLSVTFDVGGIYGKFGGAAYGGYVNGEFNIYIDAVYSWDGWLNGTDVETREITQKLFPGYFFMEGKVGTTLTMNGDSNEVYQTDLKFGNRTPGKISIEALNDLIKALPESLIGLKLQLAQVSLETMRDFAYEHADGQLRSYGREGRGTLKFTGPTGTRSFELNAYDHRWKTDPKPEKTTSSAQVAAP